MSKPKSQSAHRHARLATELASLLAWRRFSESIDPLATNWCIPANDNDEPDDTGQQTDCKYEIRPTVNEIVRAIGDGEIEYISRTSKPPLSGKSNRVARVGGLSFATVSNAPDIPLSSLIGWAVNPGTKDRKPSEAYGQPKGGRDSGQAIEDVRSTNLFFAAMLGASPHRFIRGKRQARVSHPHFTLPEQLRGTTPLAVARAWAGLPPAEKDPKPALPCGARCAADSFIGHRVTRSSQQQIELATSPHDHLARKQDEQQLQASLKSEDVTALDGALTCRNFTELGELFNKTGKTAERFGNRRLLQAANNLDTALKTLAA